jgi:hypothetical protein
LGRPVVEEVAEVGGGEDAAGTGERGLGERRRAKGDKTVFLDSCCVDRGNEDRRREVRRCVAREDPGHLGEGAIDVGVLLAVAGENRDRLGGLAEGRDGRDEDLLLA